MDQQFDTYKKNINRTWVRFNGNLLPNVEKKTRLRIIIICATVIIVSLYHLINEVKIMRWLLAESHEFFISSVYSITPLVLINSSAVFMLLKRSLGWYILLILLFKSVLMNAYVFFNYNPLGGFDNNAFHMIDDMIGYDFKELLVGVLIYIGIISYLQSKVIREVYLIAGNRKLIPYAIGAVLVLIEFLIF